MSASNQAAKRAVDRLNRRGPDDVELHPVRLDLGKLLDRLPKGGSVLGAWSTATSPNRIKSRAMFGEDLGDQDELKQMRKDGRVSSLGLVYPFAGAPLRVNVSKRCSAVFFGRASLETRLRFMELLTGFEADPGASR